MKEIPTQELIVPLDEGLSPSVFLNRVRLPRGVGGNGFVPIDEMISSPRFTINGYLKPSDPRHVALSLYRVGDLLGGGQFFGYERLKTAGLSKGTLPVCEHAFRCAAFCERDRARRQIIFPLADPVLLSGKLPL